MAFCSSCGERVDPTKPYCASCGARIDENYVSRQNHSSITNKNPSGFNKIKLNESSEETAFSKNKVSRWGRFIKVNWRVYFLASLLILLAAIYLIFDPFNNDVAFAHWGELNNQEKSSLVTDFMQENYPDVSTPAADEIIRYCNLLYEETGGKDETISTVLSEFVELDKEKRIAAIAALSGDIIEDESSDEDKDEQ